MAKRRTLAFDSLDQVMPEVDRLLEGYTLGGNWTLGADLPASGDLAPAHGRGLARAIPLAGPPDDRTVVSGSGCSPRGGCRRG